MVNAATDLRLSSQCRAALLNADYSHLPHTCIGPCDRSFTVDGDWDVEHCGTPFAFGG